MPKSALLVPRVVLDRVHRESLRQQIYAQMAGAIRRGELAAGARVPSTRLFATMLGVSRNTVVEAYERLLEEGLLVTRARSGVEVSGGARTERVPSFSGLRRTMRAAHSPERTVEVRGPDGEPLYLNGSR